MYVCIQIAVLENANVTSERYALQTYSFRATLSLFTESKGFHKIRRRSLTGMVNLIKFTTLSESGYTFSDLVNTLSHLEFTTLHITNNMNCI